MKFQTETILSAQGFSLCVRAVNISCANIFAEVQAADLVDVLAEEDGGWPNVSIPGIAQISL